jgi:hypothetical protein
LLFFHSTGVAADNESLSFRVDNATGDVVAVISGHLSSCGPRVLAPLGVEIDGTAITITSNALDSGGGCLPPPGYQNPYYEVTASLGQLSAPQYMVTWRWSGYSYDSFHRTVIFARALAVAHAIPALHVAGIVFLSFLLAISAICGIAATRAPHI